MKLIFTLLSLLLLFFANAQDITGIWKGYFIQNNFGFSEERYKYEVQIEQLANNALSGVTYSYKTTVFYGKSLAKGIYTKKTNNILFDEIKMLDLKIADRSEPCLMTLYMEYNKIGDLETLTGTYSSRNLKSVDCGSGRVYLERSATTDFYKEDFLTRKENQLKKKVNHPMVKNTGPKKLGVKPGAEANLLPKTAVGSKPALKVTAPKSTFKKSDRVQNDTVAARELPPPPPKTGPEKPIEKRAIIPPPPPIVKLVPKPDVIKNRDNNLVKTITTSAKEFKIELYDNGEIDGDRISVYHNNQLIVANKMLTDKPISFTIKSDEDSPVHDFVMVAENLGSIPPNTSLMIITAGTKRYELFVTSTEQKNAVVRVEYNPE